VPTRVIFCGDVHLGRRPAGLPDSLGALSEHTLRELGPRAALARAVAEALRLEADAFVFAGDVVDEENSRFEAYGPLRESVERLLRGGVRTFGVAGNHDVGTLPQLARDLPGFQLLGAGGRWEDASVEGRDGPRIALRGWSFPRRVVEQSPLLDERPARPADARALLCVVHGDLDVSASRYAPLRRRDLEGERDASAWFLGHVHRPSLDPASTRPIGYLGSLSALDRTETGDHGPWLAEVGDSGVVSIRHIPLAPLRFEQLELDASGWESAEQLEHELLAALGAAGERQRQSAHPARALGISVVVQGSLARLRELRTAVAGFETAGMPHRDFERLHAFIAKLEDRTRPRIDLAQRAHRDDPSGRLAQRLLALEDPASPLGMRLIAAARSAFEQQSRRQREFAGALAPIEWDEEQARERLKRMGWSALEALEATRQETA